MGTDGDIPRCHYCGNYHITLCPRIKALEYHENGLTKRVEFFAPNDYYYNYVNTNPPDKYQYPYPSIPYPITW